MSLTIFVDKFNTNKNFTYASIGEALESIPDDCTEEIIINISPGRYNEKLMIERDNITLHGMGTQNTDTEIYYDDAAFDEMEDGTKRGTFRTYTIFAGANHIKITNLTIANTSGEPTVKGQAIALYADGDNIIVQNCALLGRQDTLFTGPLPPKEIQPGGFVGPRQFAERINGHQLYKDCYICGDVDFIFGSATAYFQGCTIESLPHYEYIATGQIQGYITAASTPSGQSFGYVFDNCHFISSSLPAGSVYLGRPWRNFAKSVFINCRMDSHIHEDGFHDWNKSEARDTVEYAVYNCTRNNEPFYPKAPFARVLKDTEIDIYNIDNVMNS